MIEQSVLDELNEKIVVVQQELNNLHERLETIENEYDTTLERFISTNFDSDDLEGMKQDIQTIIINLENLVAEIDDLDL